MDIFSGLVFLILFIIIMIVIFSMGLSSPYVGKKEITFIVIIGFILGGLGGYFFIEPIYEESPYMIGSIYGLFTTDDENINLILPTSSDTNKINSEILNQDGVSSISTDGFDLKTYDYTTSQERLIENHLSSMDDVESYQISDKLISVNLLKDSQSTTTLGSLVSWLSTNDIDSEFAFIHLQVKVKASSVTDVKKYLEDEGYTIDSVEGPVHEFINNMDESLLNKWVIVFITGIIGIIVAIFGIYADSILKIFRKKS